MSEEKINKNLDWNYHTSHVFIKMWSVIIKIRNLSKYKKLVDYLLSS